MVSSARRRRRRAKKSRGGAPPAADGGAPSRPAAALADVGGGADSDDDVAYAKTMVSSEEQAFLDEAQAWVRSGGDINDVDPDYDSATRLHRACELGYRSVVRWLLENGAEVQAVMGIGRWMPLHVAADSGRCEAAVLLLDAGAHVDARSHYSSTALHCVASSPYAVDVVEMCKLLLSRGASLDARDDSGNDPEAEAHLDDCPDVAALLADVRAAGGWSAYVAAPRNQLLALRRELPMCFRTGPCSAPRAQARLFLDKKIPDDVFMHVLTFWRSARDSEY